MTQILSLLGKLASWTAAIVIIASVSVANAQQSFKTPEDAVGALVSATKDNWPKGVIAVLGRDGVDIVSSGDKVADESHTPKISCGLRRQTSGDKGRRQQSRDDHRAGGFSVSDPAHTQRRRLAVRHGRWPA